MNFFLNFANNTDSNSYAAKLRRKRFQLFTDMIGAHPNRPLKILDVGGSEIFWEVMGWADTHHNITLLNLTANECHHKNIKSVIGNACSMTEFNDKQFDIILSNSVIEHVGTLDDQIKMAKEIARVAPCYFVQTPNYWFPIEPHFLFPFFQWFPFAVRVFLVSHFSLGWNPKGRDYSHAFEMVNEIRLLTKSELHSLFPEAQILRERILGLTKSFIVMKK